MNCNELIIRKMKPTDYDALIEVWTKASLPYKPEGRDTNENILKQLKIENNLFLVAEISGKLVGAIIASHNGRKGWINRLAVLPEFREKGIASALIRKSEEFFLSNNIEIFVCLIEDWNNLSISFFQNNDYIEHRDIIYFTKKLSPQV